VLFVTVLRAVVPLAKTGARLKVPSLLSVRLYAAFAVLTPFGQAGVELFAGQGPGGVGFGFEALT
jgi:hypothetical protein